MLALFRYVSCYPVAELAMLHGRPLGCWVPNISAVIAFSVFSIGAILIGAEVSSPCEGRWQGDKAYPRFVILTYVESNLV